jgi:hypothetical protein
VCWLTRSVVVLVCRGACSIIGAWGKAVPENLLQLRALDWDTNGPFRDYSQVTVYHPDPTNSTQGHSWVNIGFTGFLGSLTGISSQQLAISEIGVSYPDSSFGNTRPDGSQGPIPIAGYPFIWLLRDILKFDVTIDDAANRMINTKRMGAVCVGVYTCVCLYVCFMCTFCYSECSSDGSRYILSYSTTSELSS